MLLVGASAAPALAQQAVSARPRTYATWNNKTPGYSYGAPIAYFGDSDSYVPARTVQGVPNNVYSYVVTQGNISGRTARLNSITFVPAMGAMPPQFQFPTTAAGQANTSFGGLIDAFGWSNADVVMNQCFGGGFAFNVAGSLQGATPAGGGAMVAPINRIPYTFASGANYNEYSYGIALPNGGAAPADITAVGDFTQGQAYGETPPGPYALSRAYRLGVTRDPFTRGGMPYGIANQVPANLQAGFFESPVYGSSDAPGVGGAPNDAAAANARTYASGAANKWAVLVAFTPNRPEFALDIEREYAALRANGVPASHIAVLYGDGTLGTLPTFGSISAANNKPDVQGILGAGFMVPVQGAASNANIAGLLNPTIIYNPTAPIIAQKNYWQQLFNLPPGAPSPVAGNSLVVYATGHGSAVNIFGGDIAAANRAVGGGVFQTDFKLDGPSNVQIIPGGDITAQITVRGMPFGLMSDVFSVDGVSVGPGVLVDPSGTELDMSSLVATTSGLSYLDITIPDELLTPMGGGSVFDLSISNTSDIATQEFQNAFAAYTWMDDSVANCAIGACDLYTDLVSAPVPEPSAWMLLIGGAGLVGGALRRRQADARA
jgi:PEP-CTERM motif